MRKKTKRERAPVKLAIDVNKRDRGMVVTLARARWKAKHTEPTEKMIRMVRFVWMRSPFHWDERIGLHAGLLQRCLAAGLLERGAAHDALRVSKLGESLLEMDRGSEQYFH